MTTTSVTTADGTYLVLPGERWRTTALVLVPLLDEWTQAPPSGITARALSAGAYAHVTGGRLVITGVAERALPGLALGDVDLDVQLLRPGRLPQPVTVTVPMGAALPYTAPSLAVASLPITLTGRVTAAAFPRGPVAGATVALAGVGQALLALPLPLGLGHPAGTTVRERSVTGGAATTLIEPVTGGDAVLRLASTAGLGAGSVLAVGVDLVVVDAVTGPVVTLRTPTVAGAPAGGPVTVQTLGATGAATTLSRDAQRGDAVLPVAAALAGALVEVVDGTATEYRHTPLVTDADGRWRLPGVRGVPEITLTTSASGFVTAGPRRYPLAPIDPFVVPVALAT